MPKFRQSTWSHGKGMPFHSMANRRLFQVCRNEEAGRGVYAYIEKNVVFCVAGEEKKIYNGEEPMEESMQSYGNREYKGRLFKLIFREKRDLLELYNALNDTAYENPEEIEVNTLEDVVYLGMKNDISFLLQEVLNLYEHQSTMSPNLPLRGLFYFSTLYRRIVADNHDIYSSKRIELPLPKFVIFYNGRKEEPEQMTLYLHDAFPKRYDVKEADLDCRAVLLNINAGQNPGIMKKCRRLEEYSIFVARIREYQTRSYTIEEAIDRAVDECIQEGLLAELLRSQREEVRSMLLTEYNEQAHIESERKIAADEAYAQGMEAGIAQGMETGIAQGMEIGIEEGEDLFGLLTDSLMTDSRMDDLRKAAKDKEYRAKLYEEYGLKRE